MSARDRRRERENRLRMDSYAGGVVGGARGARGGRAPSPTKRREMDKVMKKARSRDGATQSNYWNKKLLEAEEKDPNRWRHSGYKELYASPTGSQRSRSRSKVNRGRAPRSRSRSRSRKPHTPQPTTSRALAKPGPSRKSAVSASPSSRSLSSCSDESCSVCSPKLRAAAAANNLGNPSNKGKRKAAVSPPAQPPRRSRSRSFSVPRNRPGPPPAEKAPRGPRPRQRSGPPRDPRGPPPSPPPKAKPSRPLKPARTKKSVPKKRRPKPAPPVVVIPEAATSRRRATADESGVSDDSSGSSVESSGAPPKLTLSERFGKMAQWSVDRRDLDGVKNMRITKDSASSDLKVVIEDARYRASSPMPLSDRRVGAGHFPEALHEAPLGLDAWDDVRVRYKYYRDRGYLRDLTLDDYVKWEEWWYKYQEWLEAERYYERWNSIREQQDKMFYQRVKHRRY